MEQRKYSLTRIRCSSCSWVSDEMTMQERGERGVPWYCDACGQRAPKYINYEPHERAEVARRWGLV